MGRLAGRRPDRTEAIARAARRHLADGEAVVAGIDVQTSGTSSAGLRGGASGAVGAAVGNLPPHLEGGEEEHATWLTEATAVGIDPAVARRTVWASLLLTDRRLIVLGRSRLTRRVTAPLIDWPVHDIERLDVPKQGMRATIHVGGRSLTFELPVAPRFRPSVYHELPDRLAAVQEAARRS